MSIDPVTFILEILNFLVLIWLLQRFLYKPIKAAIAQRQQALEQGVVDAEQRESEAASLKATYDANLQRWESEQAQRQSKLQQSLAEEREQALDEIRRASKAETTRLQQQQAKNATTVQHAQQEQAVELALHLTSRMLKRLASPALDNLLLQVLIEDLQQLPTEGVAELIKNVQQQQGKVSVVSAHPLSDAQLHPLQTCLQQLSGTEIQLKTTVDSGLLSGLRLDIGALLLHANLQDELAFFNTEQLHGAC